MVSVNYIVAFYSGPRRHYGSTTPIMKFAKEHVKFLSLSPNLITKATFVFNTYDDELEREVFEYLNTIKLPMEFELIKRPNSGMSYGGWNDVISKTISDFDFSFTIEDDYIPNRLDFIEYFINELDDNTIFVASLYDRNHAAISNGLFVNSKSYNPAFTITSDNSYANGAVQNQKYYLTKYTESGYTIKDICDVGYTEFLDAGKNIMQYRNNKLPLLITPILL